MKVEGVTMEEEGGIVEVDVEREDGIKDFIDKIGGREGGGLRRKGGRGGGRRESTQGCS